MRQAGSPEASTVARLVNNLCGRDKRRQAVAAQQHHHEQQQQLQHAGLIDWL